jgi:hypothetical protein
MRRKFLSTGLKIRIELSAFGILLAGCQMLDHSNTLIFATNTNFGIQVGTDATSVPTVNIGYRRQEGVIMPLVSNVKDSEGKRLPCFASDPGGKGGRPPARASAIKTPEECKLVAKNTDGNSQNLEDAYSVLASFGATFSGQGNGTGAEASGGLAQYFATGAAAQLLAKNGGAAVVAVGPAAKASTTATSFERSAAFTEKVDIVAANLNRVKGLSDTQALMVMRTMEPRIMQRDAKIQTLVKGIDSMGQRSADAATAKRVLQAWIVIDDRDDDSIKQWTDALDAATK